MIGMIDLQALGGGAILELRHQREGLHWTGLRIVEAGRTRPRPAHRQPAADLRGMEALQEVDAPHALERFDGRCGGSERARSPAGGERLLRANDHDAAHHVASSTSWWPGDG
ncbi:MAG TPA: hypothetical protein VNM87_03010 [Candidatus Udaeobacter sp.]|nr:hypothetical protein [Candidatus Udaeobacter sp.]